MKQLPKLEPFAVSFSTATAEGKEAKEGMVDLEALGKDLDEAMDKMEATSKKITEAQAAGKDEDVKTLTKEYGDLEGKAANLTDQFGRVKKHQALHATRLELRGIATPEGKPEAKPGDMPSGKSLPQKPPAEARNHDEEARDHEKFFEMFILGKDSEIPDRAWGELLQSKNPAFIEGKSGCTLPKRLARTVLESPDVMPIWGKALPMVSSDALRSALVPQEYKPELLQLPPEPPTVYARTRKVPCMTGLITYPRVVQTDAQEYGGVTARWISEGALKPATEATFEQVQIATHEIAARTELSRTLLSRSSINLESFIAIEFKAAIMNLVDTAFLTGTGTGQPLGVFTAAGIRTVNRAVAGQIAYADLVNLEHAIRANHRANGVFVIGDNAMAYLKQTLDNDGRPLFVPDPSTGAYKTLLGYPYVTTHRLSLGTNDIVFGDWSQYIVPLEQDIVIQKSVDRKIEENVIVFVVFMLIGGRPVQTRAFVKLIGPSSS